MARGEKIWVVRAGDGNSVGDILRRIGDESAIEQGRAFIGKKRALRLDQPVRVGDAVRVSRAQDQERATKLGETSAAPIEILFHEQGLLAVNKPAGLPTVPDHAGASHSLVARAANAIGLQIDQLRVTSRLDREVSGVVVFALDGMAEERLKNARAAGQYARRYIALAKDPNADAPRLNEGVWDEPIGRSPSDARLRLVGGGPDAKAACTHWQRIAVAFGMAMLAIDPQTGRTHQIRVHASHAGAPLLGDRDYGGASRIILSNGRILAPSRIALHAARVVVPGEKGAPIAANAPIPAELASLWAALGGEAEAWNRALSCPVREEKA
jgi:23S rRNA pseudouridine1911/1915/1917 synthase